MPALPVFEPIIRRFGEVESHSGTVFGLLPDLSLAYFNAAWLDFAAANGLPSIRRDWDLGSSILDAMSGPLRAYYHDHLHRSLRERRVWTHRYECSSAELCREFALRTYPVEEGLLVVNSLLVEMPHSASRVTTSPSSEYRAAQQLLRQCSHCRRFHHPAHDRWDWIPAWVEHPPAAVTHGLCAICLDYYYPPRAP